MRQPKLYLCYGGGLGDVVWDFLTDRTAWALPGIVKGYNARVRVYTQCHNDGVEDLFKYQPYIHEHVMEDWSLPSPENAQRFSQPIGEYLPMHRHDILAMHDIYPGAVERPQIYLSDREKSLLARLMAKRPNIIVQPYAGLSDRDALDPPSLRRLVDALVQRDPNVSILVVGKNHIRTHKYAREEVGFTHPNVTDLIDQVGIRLGYHLVANCDAFCGAHSNLIRTAWDFRKRNACILPMPLMESHLASLDPKYSYGWRYPESRKFTYHFEAGGPRQFETIDVDGLATFLLRGE